MMTALIVLGVLLALGSWLTLWIISLRRVVPTNMVHIVQSTKTSTPYGRGREAGNTYYEWPTWLPIIGVTVTTFPESIFKVDLSDYEAYDSARLPFMVDVCAFFRVDNAAGVAQRVESFRELNEQLRAVLQGSVRRILATNALEDIMQERAKLGDQFTDEVREQISEWGVVPVKTIEFMDIRDSRNSEVIANIMEKEKSRIEKESRSVVAENMREAQVKEIEAQREVDVRKQEALQAVGIRTAEKEKIVGMENEKAQQEIKAQAKITAERDMEVLKVNETRRAEINKATSIIKAEEMKQVQVVRAEGEKQVNVVTAEGHKEAAERAAEAALFTASKNAEGIKLEGLAKGDAETAILMAPVNAQTKLAETIGSNEGYQNYLVSVRKVEAEQIVGVAMAKSLEEADLKVIANTGTVGSGLTSLGDIFTSKGGTQIGAMLEGLSNTEEGRKLLNTVMKLSGEAAAKAPELNPEKPAKRNRVN